jgi:hypothetical protein
MYEVIILGHDMRMDYGVSCGVLLASAEHSDMGELFGNCTNNLPSRGGDDFVTNSIVVGSLSDARRSANTDVVNNVKPDILLRLLPSLASSSRIGTPPISNMTRPVATLKKAANSAASKNRCYLDYLPSSPKLKRSFSLPHSSFIPLISVERSIK